VRDEILNDVRGDEFAGDEIPKAGGHSVGLGVLYTQGGKDRIDWIHITSDKPRQRAFRQFAFTRRTKTMLYNFRPAAHGLNDTIRGPFERQLTNCK
jgi:hypothetical protein